MVAHTGVKMKVMWQANELSSMKHFKHGRSINLNRIKGLNVVHLSKIYNNDILIP